MKKFLVFSLIICILISIILIKFADFYKLEHYEIVEKYSEEFGLEKALIFAIIKNESGFDKEAISNKNAKGLMQILEETKQDVEKVLNISNLDLLSEEENILVGTKYLQILNDKYKDINLAIIAYNAGPGTVDKWLEEGKIAKDNLENIPYKETANYLKRVLRDKKIYEKLLEIRIVAEK